MQGNGNFVPLFKKNTSFSCIPRLRGGDPNDKRGLTWIAAAASFRVVTKKKSRRMNINMNLRRCLDFIFFFFFSRVFQSGEVLSRSGVK